MNNIFWGDNIQVLFNIKYLKEFIPTEKMSFTQRLNAISRFIIYYFTLLSIYNNNFKNILYCILLLIVIYYIYNINKNKYNTEPYNNFENQNSNDIENEDNKSKYTSSTKNNPFMNVLLNELSEGERKPANYCDKNIEDNFSNNIYSDIEDIFNRKTASRQFYTNPVTTSVNDQTNFAKFLYNKPSCKNGDKEQCVRNINNRHNLR
tara:strand:- start:903 stop:1520 length:618 start_codon:yes stop_codon:yes gene_type:complete